MGALMNTSASPRLNVGIDVSGDFLDIAFHETGEHFRLTNTPEGIQDLLARLKEVEVELVVMEATGKLELAVLSALCHAGFPAVAMNPRQVRDFARASGKRAKTDRIDALMIARFAALIAPEVRPLNDEQTQQLQALMMRRLQLMEMRVAENNRLNRAHTAARPSLKEHIKWLTQRIEVADGDIDSFLKSSPVWRQKSALLTSVPGVGAVTTSNLIAFMPELGSLDRREIASLAGVAPFNVDSGNMRGKRRVQGGRAVVRKALYMACITAMRRNWAIKAFAERLKSAGKPFKVVIVACMRKLLTILNSMLRNATPWVNVPIAI
jgi:transposase